MPSRCQSTQIAGVLSGGQVFYFANVPAFLPSSPRFWRRVCCHALCYTNKITVVLSVRYSCLMDWTLSSSPTFLQSCIPSFRIANGNECSPTSSPDCNYKEAGYFIPVLCYCRIWHLQAVFGSVQVGNALEKLSLLCNGFNAKGEWENYYGI